MPLPAWRQAALTTASGEMLATPEVTTMRYGVGGVGAAGAFFCSEANSDFFVKPTACSSLESAPYCAFT